MFKLCPVAAQNLTSSIFFAAVPKESVLSLEEKFTGEKDLIVCVGTNPSTLPFITLGCVEKLPSLI